jgi:hypothetical protein
MAVVTNPGVTGVYTQTDRQTYAFTNVTPDRAVNADSTTTDELADALGTLISDLRSWGLVL